MSQTQTVTINGREYDARTGLPVVSSDKQQATRTTRKSLRHTADTSVVAKNLTPTENAKPAQNIHQKTQRSKTLNRKFTKKPGVSRPVQAQTIAPRTNKRLDGFKAPKKSSSLHSPVLTASARRAERQLTPITSTPKTAPAPKAAQTVDTPPMPHPAVTRAHQVQAAKKAAPSKQLPSASVIKQAVIQEALENAPAHHAKQHKHVRSYRQRLAGVVFGCAALVLFAGYLTYLNVPNISVRVAAAQAGIDASYPSYQPDGYRLNGPVAYSNGTVQIQFAANTGTSGFTLNQSRSNWDSSALLENYVKEKSHDEYSTAQEKGLTIYNYGSNAAWVSGGILYTIDGDAPLSPDQIRKIATSV